MELVNDQYQIQGVSMQSIADEFGTPVYIYDAEKIKSQYGVLSAAFSVVNLKIKYAAKSLTNISILKLLKSFGSELDCVSIQEVEMGLMAGFKPKEILFTPSGVGLEEIDLAVEMGVNINLDSLSILNQFGKKYGDTFPIGLRLNPHVMAGGNEKISTGHENSKFGVSIKQLKEIINCSNQYGVVVQGLHIHTGSDILDADVFLKVANILFEAARNFSSLKFLDLGSGFKVAYKEGDVVTDIQDVGSKLSKAFNDFCDEYGKQLELWFEPGKFLVSESGYLLAATNVVKKTPTNVFVGINTGLNHLIRPMMYEAYHDIVNISNPGGQKNTYNVVGYICETDTFGSQRALNEVSEGDLIAIKNAGAYCYSMASNYNSRFRPCEVLVYKGEAKLIREREKIDDLLRNQIEIDI
jgi:diaminopimelate decarboxylase